MDLFTTISQGRAGRFDIERTNGAWRGGFPDNENLSRTETVPVTDPATQPQWTSTTLPYKEIVSAGTGRFPVYDNTSVTEIPAGRTDPVVRPDGPTDGSTAREGGGGNYLSNEIAYRATLLRDRLGLHDRLPGAMCTRRSCSSVRATRTRPRGRSPMPSSCATASTSSRRYGRS